VYGPALCLRHSEGLRFASRKICGGDVGERSSGAMGVESLVSATRELREMGCEDGRWMELAQDRVQGQLCYQ
jgi:hypothetical protein